MIDITKFTPFTNSSLKVRTPFLNTSNFVHSAIHPCHFYLTADQVKNFEDLLHKKGNCSTNDAGSRIAFGNVYGSHALTFYLYNYSALRVIDQFIPDKDDKIVLELGCNNGHVSRLFQRNGFKFKEYWGMDFDFSFILDGVKLFTKEDNLFQSNFCSGNFNKTLNFKDDSFDLVYFQEAFDHCTDKFFYAEQCISEIKRVLKHNGFLYITLCFEHSERDLYHWDHNYVWDKFRFETMIKDYFEIINFVPLLTFDKLLKETHGDLKKVYQNWPPKFAKMICAQFVDSSSTAVGAYFLMNK
jgi:SAM-dependent methyltransferase